MPKLPFMQFYAKDWLGDPTLRSCSLAARGLWIDILMLSWECPQRGILRTNGKPWTTKQIATAVGALERAVIKCLQELESAGVFDRDSDGAIISRRIVREELRRESDRVRQDESRINRSPVTDLSRKNPLDIAYCRSQNLDSTVHDSSFESGDYRNFARRYRQACGVLPGREKKKREAYSSLCIEFGEDRVLAALDSWAEARGGAARLKGNPFAARDFLFTECKDEVIGADAAPEKQEENETPFIDVKKYL